MKNQLSKLILMSALITSGSVHSTNINWSGGISTDWNSANNWTPSQVPTASDLAILSSGGARLDITIGNGVAAEANGINVSENGYTITLENTGSLSLSDVLSIDSGFSLELLHLKGSGDLILPGITLSGLGASATILGDTRGNVYCNGPVIIDSPTTSTMTFNFVRVPASNSVLYVNGPLADIGASVVNLSTASDEPHPISLIFIGTDETVAVCSGVISGVGALQVGGNTPLQPTVGPANVTFASPNEHSGGVVFVAGDIVLQDNRGLGSGGLQILNNGFEKNLIIEDGLNIANPINLLDSTAGLNLRSNAPPNLGFTLSGLIEGSSSGFLNIDNGTIVIFDGSRPNTFEGGLFVADSMVQVNAEGGLGEGVLNIGGLFNSSLIVKDGLEIANTIELSSDGEAPDITVEISSNGGSSGITLTGLIKDAPGNSAAIKIINGSKVIFAGTVSNTFTSGVILDDGTIQLNQSRGLGSGALIIPNTLSDKLLLLTDGLNVSNPIILSSELQLASTGASGATLSGLITQDAGGSLRIVEGKIIFGGLSDNTFSGDVFLDKGTIELHQSKGIGTGTLQIADNSEVKRLIILDGSTYENNINLNNNDPEFGLFMSSTGPSGAIVSSDISNIGTLFITEGKITLTGISTGASVTSILSGAILQVNAGAISPGQETNVLEKAILQGSGMIGVGLNSLVNNFGLIKPGNSIGTMFIAGNYEQHSGGKLLIEINAASTNNCDLLQVTNNALLDGQLIIRKDASQPFGYYIHDSYTILTTGGELTGAFSSIEQGLIRRFAVGEANNSLKYITLPGGGGLVELNLGSGLLSSATTPNEEMLFQTLVNLNTPNPQQQQLINLIIESNDSLFDRLGEVYGNLMLANSVTGTHFINAIYDPLRSFLACPASINTCAAQSWVDVAGIGGSYSSNNSSRGFSSGGVNIATGLQAPLCSNLVIGAALFYEYNNISFQDTGCADSNTILGGLYALYRPQNYYLFADLNGGYSFNHLSKTGFGLITKSNPGAGLLTFYAETGRDINFSRFLLQPFFGVNISYNAWNNLNEDGDNLLTLSSNSRNYTEVTSKLGLHLYYKTDYGMLLGLDADWACRLTNRYDYRNFMYNKEFTAYGVNLSRNSFTAGLFASKQINYQWRAYGEGTLRAWSQAIEGSILAGITYSW